MSYNLLFVSQDLFSRARILRWGFDIEALALARKLGYHIKIIPVYWQNDPYSHVTLKGYINTFRELFLIRLNLWRDVYGIFKKPRPDEQPVKNTQLSSLYEEMKKKEPGDSFIFVPGKQDQREEKSYAKDKKKSTAKAR